MVSRRSSPRSSTHAPHGGGRGTHSGDAYLCQSTPGDPAFVAMEAVRDAGRSFEAVRALTMRGARLRPLDAGSRDLHWIDTSAKSA